MQPTERNKIIRGWAFEALRYLMLLGATFFFAMAAVGGQLELMPFGLILFAGYMGFSVWLNRQREKAATESGTKSRP